MAKKVRSNKKTKVVQKEQEEEPTPTPAPNSTVLLADDDSSSEDEEPQEQEPAQPFAELNEDATSSEDEDKDEQEPDNDNDTDMITAITTTTTTTTTNTTAAFKSDGKYHNKQRCLIICSRGVTSRFRHLLEDLKTLIPHHKKESKLDASKSDKGGIGGAVNDIAEIRGCNSVLFLECRKRQDAYLWLGHTGKKDGPSAKFLVENIHTMDELRLTGNCMRGSRPVLTFDTAFDSDAKPELKLLKCLFTDVFGTPRGHPKSKPFVDRVMGFYYADGKIWVRNYQIVEEHATNAKEANTEKKLTGSDMKTSLVEIGPRFVLNPIRIFRGSFGGQTLFQNEQFVSPNAVRAEANRNKGNDYEGRKVNQRKRKEREDAIVLPDDPLDSVFQ